MAGSVMGAPNAHGKVPSQQKNRRVTPRIRPNSGQEPTHWNGRCYDWITKTVLDGKGHTQQKKRRKGGTTHKQQRRLSRRSPHALHLEKQWEHLPILSSSGIADPIDPPSSCAMSGEGGMLGPLSLDNHDAGDAAAVMSGHREYLHPFCHDPPVFRLLVGTCAADVEKTAGGLVLDVGCSGVGGLWANRWR